MTENLLRKFLSDSSLRVLALDPGETTGACLFEGPNLVDSRQLTTGLMPLAAAAVRDYIFTSSGKYGGRGMAQVVVMEGYRVYSWKTDSHAWQGLHTPRLIGAVELICHDLGIPLVQQTAQQGKGFATDYILREWGLWEKGHKHARDAIRHAIYYLLFTHAEVHKKIGQQAL